MSHKLDDITLYYYPKGEIAKNFTLRQNMVSDLYVQFLNKYKPKGTSRISVELSDEDRVRGYFGSILLVDAKFNKEDYWKRNDFEQNKVILDTIHRIATLCADEYNWDKDVFQNAYVKVIESNFNFKVELKRKLSKTKRYYASISIVKDVEKAMIFCSFYNSDQELINKVKLIDTFQHEMFYGGIVNNNKWFSDEEFGLYTKGEELIIKAFVNQKEPQINIIPKVNNREEIEGYLKRMTYAEINS
jgi:hypothetical protein